jgi:hypothetical protein
VLAASGTKTLSDPESAGSSRWGFTVDLPANKRYRVVEACLKGAQFGSMRSCCFAISRSPFESRRRLKDHYKKQKIVTRWMATICFWVTPESHRD